MSFLLLSSFFLLSFSSANINTVQTYAFDFTQEEEAREGSGLVEWHETVMAVTEDCCARIRVELTDGAGQESRQGVYSLTTYSHNNHAEYHQEGGTNIVYYYRNTGWYVGGDYDTSGIQSESSTLCPDSNPTWRVWTGQGWRNAGQGEVEISCYKTFIGENQVPSEETLVGEGYVPTDQDGPNDDCSSYSYENLPHPRILLLGATGVGKSVLSNQLLGCYYKDQSCQEFSVGHGSLSHTNQTTYRYGNYLGKGKCFTIIDTPGVLDFSDRDYQHAMDIVNVVKNDIKVIDVFLLLFDGSRPRFQRPVVELLNLYQSMFTPAIWKNTITEFTFWKHDEDSVEDRLDEQEMTEERKHREWNKHYKEKLNIPIEIPSIFIDPVFPIFSSVARHRRKIERQPEAKTKFQYYTYLLLDLALRMPAYSCSGKCTAPDEFFLGAPLIQAESLAVKEATALVIECQVWNGYEGGAADNYVWTHNGQTVYQKQTVSGHPAVTIDPAWEGKIEVKETVSPGAAHFTEIQFILFTFESSYVGVYAMDNGHTSSRSSVMVVLARDGTWAQWGEWEPCSKTCVQAQQDPGRRERRRVCIPPQHGGQPCQQEEEVDTQVCAGEGQEMRFCPIDYSLNEWTEWSRCSHSCGAGISTRTRLCNQGRYGGRECPALEEKEQKPCFMKPCSAQQNTGCVLLEWGTWSACTRTCLDHNNPQYGTRMRRRKYEESDPNNPRCVEGSDIIQIDRRCAGYLAGVEECARDAVWSEWSEYSACSASCSGTGEQRRFRSCMEGSAGGRRCSGLSGANMEHISCYSGPCALDCQWSSWGQWEPCDRNYGRGNQVRRRGIFVAGKHGGATCLESDASEQRECIVQAPRCKVGEWSAWNPAECPKTPGQHSQTRERSFINEVSKFTGYDCSEKEREVETRLCQVCPAGWHYVVSGNEHHCYRVLRDIPRNWTQARDACRQANGYLAEVTSQAENEAVLKYLKDYEDVDVWIGLNDREKENEFHWAKSKEKLGAFTYWETIYSREPNNGVPHWGEEDCVFLYARALSAHRKWNDLNCRDNSEANIPLYALCEYDFQDYAVKDCVYEDEEYRYCKVGVKPGTTLRSGTVAQACQEVGMEAVCSGNTGCRYYTPECAVTPLSTKCYAPMYTLSSKVCNGRQPRECPAVQGLFSHMWGLSGGECGVVGSTWCAKGNDITVKETRQYYAYCAQRKATETVQAVQCRLPYTPLRDNWRKMQNVRNSGLLAPVCSDRAVTFRKQWYRFSAPAGSRIPTAPSSYQGYNNICSHDRAGWLQGEYPALGEDPVIRRICFASQDFGQSCHWSVEAEVVACEEGAGTIYYLYHLPPTPQCSLVYCAL